MGQTMSCTSVGLLKLEVVVLKITLLVIKVLFDLLAIDFSALIILEEFLCAYLSIIILRNPNNVKSWTIFN